MNLEEMHKMNNLDREMAEYEGYTVTHRFVERDGRVYDTWAKRFVQPGDQP